MIEIEYPALLQDKGPKVRAYPVETIFAEKVETIVRLGMANSRLKDYYDLVTLAREFTFDGEVLIRAVRATFERRGTSLPIEPCEGLGETFAGAMASRWTAFRGTQELEDAPADLVAVLEELRRFIEPVLESSRTGRRSRRTWTYSDGWQEGT